MRRRGAPLILLGLALVAVVALAVSGAGDRHPRAFALGVSPQAVIAPLAPGSPACQGPITVPAAFDTLDIALGTFGRPGPPLRVSVRGGGVARSARIPAAAYEGDQAHVRVTFALVPAGRRISVCVANLGRRRIGVLGAPDAATYESHLSLGGRRFHADAAIEFERTHPIAVLDQAGSMARRASLFRPGFVGAWTLWLLAALAVLGVPALLALGLGRASAAAAAEAEPEAGQEQPGQR